MSQRHFFVYVMASHSRTLYIGVTADLARRVAEHRGGAGGSFTKRYRVRCLVYAEAFDYVVDALRREKQLKGWTRQRKIALIETANPGWSDLADLPLPDPSLRSG
jgi:putative endonuclease